MSEFSVKCKNCNKPIIKLQLVTGSSNPYWIHDRKDKSDLIYCLNNKGKLYRKSLDGRNLTAKKP